jgi:hypothetical protein
MLWQHTNPEEKPLFSCKETLDISSLFWWFCKKLNKFLYLKKKPPTMIGGFLYHFWCRS